MCFSAEASAAAAAVLLPAGVYTVAAAWRKDRAYLPLAVVPVLFGVQQACEAGVWWGLGHQRPDVVRASAVAFLLFAIAWWPGWIPLAVARLEVGWRRRLFGGLAVVGFAAGFAAFGTAVARYGEWVEVEVAGHSINYNFSRLPGADTPVGLVWQGTYMVCVVVPLLLSAVRRVVWLGVLLAAAAVLAHLAHHHAFASVWCFFAAVISAYIAYMLFRLPAGDKLSTPATPTPEPL